MGKSFMFNAKKSLTELKPKSLCILRLSAIGDVCHAVAMVQMLQAQLPETKITWVVGKIEAMLLEGLEGVELVVFDKKAGLEGFKALRRHFKGRKFDVLLQMQVAFRSSLASLCIPAKVKVGFDKERAIEGQWLFTNARIAPQQQPHVLEGFMGFAKAIGVDVAVPKWHMPLSDEHIAFAEKSLPTEQPIAVISPAASKAQRNWTSQGYAQIADYLTQKGFAIALCGGPSQMEHELANNIVQNSSAPETITNLVGKTSLKQLLAVLKHAHLVIAPDTGPAHMATTVNTPVVGLYAHSNPGRTGPYTSQKYVVSVYQQHVEQQQNKRLAEIPWGTRAKGDDLMQTINFDMVKAKVDLLLEDFPIS